MYLHSSAPKLFDRLSIVGRYDIMKWKRFLHYFSLWGKSTGPVDSSHKGSVIRIFDISFNVSYPEQAVQNNWRDADNLRRDDHDDAHVM